jgi:lipopolysaccharide biosynthesis regulator YciM
MKKQVLILLAVHASLACTPVCAIATSEADDLLTRNHYQQAEDAYRKLIDTDETGDAYAGLAVSLSKQPIASKIVEAEKVLKQGKSKFPDNSNIIVAAGYVSYVHSCSVASPAKRDQYLCASENLCKRAIQDNPEILLAQQTLGLVKMAQDDYEGAIQPFRKSIAIAGNAVNLTMLAQVLLKLNAMDHEAAELVDKALALRSDYVPARLQKAIVLLHQQTNANDALVELKSIPEDWRTADWYLVAGDVYYGQGNTAEAVSSWRESLNRSFGDNEEARRRLFLIRRQPEV